MHTASSRSSGAGTPANAHPSCGCASCRPAAPLLPVAAAALKTLLPPTLPLACPAPAHAQALVDFPGQTRRVISFKRLALTDFTVDIPRLAKKSVLKKAVDEAGE